MEEVTERILKVGIEAVTFTLMDQPRGLLITAGPLQDLLLSKSMQEGRS